MYQKVAAKKFVEIRSQVPARLSVFLTDYSAADYEKAEAACYLSKDEKSGYAIKPDGDLISVFSLPGAKHGAKAIISAIKNGATMLDCFDGFLPSFYMAFGFVEYDRIAWDDDYAPINWDYKEHGTPDIVYMKRE